MDHPAPDLMDSSGRLRRLAVSLLIGVAVGAAAYFLANTLIAPEAPKVHVTRQQMGRDTFVIWVTLLASVVGFVVGLILQNRFARTRWERERVPKAQVR